MELLIPLWLPILLSAAAVWVISAIACMALPHHKQDFIGLPDADGFMDYIRRSASSPATTSSPISAARGDEIGEIQRPWRKARSATSALADAADNGRQTGRHLHRLRRRQHPHCLPHARRASRPAGFAKSLSQIAATAGILAYSFSFIPTPLGSTRTSAPSSPVSSTASVFASSPGHLRLALGRTEASVDRESRPASSGWTRPASWPHPDVVAMIAAAIDQARRPVGPGLPSANSLAFIRPVPGPPCQK